MSAMPTIVIVAAAASVLAASAVALRRRRIRRGPARVGTPTDRTALDERGAVRSVQGAELTLPAGELERIWTARDLERLARTYWRFLERVTLHLIRVVYGESERAV